MGKSVTNGKQLNRSRARGGRSWSFNVGAVLTILTLALIVTGFFYTPYDPDAMQGSRKFLAPSLAHLMGTDNFGRDLFSRVLRGAGTSLIIALATVAVSALIGILVGALTSYIGGAFDEVVMRINDGIASFPSVLLAMVLISVMGTGKYKIMAALIIVFIPSFARVARSEFLKYKDMDFALSARLMGVSHARILFAHILPNCLPVLFSSMTIGFNNAVLAEAGMSYLGLGVQPPDASLGRMLAEGQTYITSSPWCVLGPGLFMIVMVLGVGLLGDGLNERMGGAR